MSQTFAHKPTLDVDGVILRPFVESDIAVMKGILAEQEVLTLTGSEHEPETPEDALTAWYSSRNEQTDRLDLAIVDQALGSCVGEVVLNDYDPGNRSCGLRILIGSAGRDRGIGTKATALMVDYAFDQLGLNRVGLEVYDFNPRARRAYEKVGFVAEGTLREALRHGDGWIDATVMSILRREWSARASSPTA